MTAIDGKFFRDRIKDRGLTVQEVARRLGLNSHSQLSLMLGGKLRMQLDEAIGLSGILSLPLPEIIAHAGFPSVIKNSSRVIPVVGALRGSGVVEEIAPLKERAAGLDSLPDDCVAVQARTLDSPLNWMDRFVFFCGEKQALVESIIGRFCLLKIRAGHLVLGALHRGYGEDTYAISGPYSCDAAKIEWARPVIMTRN